MVQVLVYTSIDLAFEPTTTRYLFYEPSQGRWKRGTEAKLGQPSLNVSRTLDLN